AFLGALKILEHRIGLFLKLGDQILCVLFTTGLPNRALFYGRIESSAKRLGVVPQILHQIFHIFVVDAALGVSETAPTTKSKLKATTKQKDQWRLIVRILPSGATQSGSLYRNLPWPEQKSSKEQRDLGACRHVNAAAQNRIFGRFNPRKKTHIDLTKRPQRWPALLVDQRFETC